MGKVRSVIGTMRDRGISERLIRKKVARRRFQQQRGLCFYCCEPLGAETTKDHFYPLGRGGNRSWQNIVLACRCCNQAKGPREPSEDEQDHFRVVLGFDPHSPRNRGL